MKCFNKFLVSLIVIFLFLIFLSGISYAKVKSIHDLTSEEQELMIDLLHKAYTDIFGERARFFSKVTLYYLSKKDGDIRERGIGEKLDEPIETLGVGQLMLFDIEDMKSNYSKTVKEVKEEVYSLQATDRITGRKLRIIKCVVQIDSDSCGMHMSCEKVTVIPLLLEIE